MLVPPPIVARSALHVCFVLRKSAHPDTPVSPAHPSPGTEINDNIERVAKYSARLRQLRQRRDSLEAALAAAAAESGLPSRQQEADLLDDTGGFR